ncbi:MAG: hypothetical protein FJZ12_04005 [Candidatus Omnitrophica bacterium]|nr:hypothetical protein [Candidatus Omnitrophota bacterium]
MIKKSLPIVLLLAILFVWPSYAADETLTITTYYPSPAGSYNELDTNYLNFGLIDNPPDSGSSCSQEGQTLYNSNTRQLYICNGSNWAPVGGGEAIANPILPDPDWVLVARNLRFEAHHEFLIKYSLSLTGQVRQIKVVVVYIRDGDWPPVGYEFYLRPPSYFDGWAHTSQLNNWIQFGIQNLGNGNINLIGWGVDQSSNDFILDVDVYVSY